MNHVHGERLEVLKEIYQGVTDPITVIAMLGRYWKIKIWYDHEVEVRIRRSRRVIKEDPDGSTLRIFRTKATSKIHVFNKIEYHQSKLLYRTTRRATFGWWLPMEGIIKYEPVIECGRKLTNNIKETPLWLLNPIHVKAAVGNKM